MTFSRENVVLEILKGNDSITKSQLVSMIDEYVLVMLLYVSCLFCELHL